MLFRFIAISFAAAIAPLLATSALAQPYRFIGPDGSVTYSDIPPAGAAVSPRNMGLGIRADRQDGASGSALPYELKQVVKKYPVTIYTTNNCQPCDEGRNLLLKMGVPFVEKTVTSNDDIEQYKAISGSNNLPLLTIGSKQVGVYSSSNWTSYLKAAGYPSTNQLPKGYRAPTASPLSNPTSSLDEGASNDSDGLNGQNPTKTPTPDQPPQNQDHPSGIRF